MFVVKKNMQIDTEIDDNGLREYLIYLVAAYRKSYKLYGNIIKAFNIAVGVFSCSAVLAVIPAIPVFVAAVGLVVPLISVIQDKSKLLVHKDHLKKNHRKFKLLMTEYSGKKIDKTETVKRFLDIQKSDSYVEPLERYMKEFNLNGYKKK